MLKKSARPRFVIFTALLAVLVLIPALAGLYGYLNRDRIFPERGTVVVYGREECVITRSVRNGLDKKGIPYVFADVDIAAIHDELRYKLGSKFKEPSYTYPVVHVGGKILLTPTADQIQGAIVKEPAKSERDFSTFLAGAEPVPHY